MAEKSGLEGKVVVRWVIDAQGAVTKAEIASSSIASEGLHRCILAEIQQWKFAAQQDAPVTVNYPFVLTQNSP